MTDRLVKTFADCKEKGRCAFVPYVTAGYPTMDSTVPLMMALQEGGADVIELGMPFSDPLADGPTIQRCSHVALQNGVTVDDCLRYVQEARAGGLTIPVVLMGYYNPFVSYGEERLVAACKEATISGFIIVDLPIEEADVFSSACNKHGLSFIPLVAPTSTDARLEQIAAVSSGYVYCVSVTGITGARSDLPEDLKQFTERVRKFFKTIPLAVGFGLSTPEHIKGVSALAEGAVVGSAVIKKIDEGKNTEESCKLLTEFTKHLYSLV